MIRAAGVLVVAAGTAAAPGLPGAGGASGAGGPSAAAPDTVVIDDDAGRTVRFPERPERIVSLAPAFTEILFALGAGDRVVGRTKYGVHPPRAREVPGVGEGVRPSMEMIVSRRPDAVILYAGTENRQSLHRLEELGVPTVALEHDGVGDLYRNVQRLGRLVGRAEAADRLSERIRCELRAVSERVRTLPTRRVYYEVWADPPITVGSGSYLDSLLTIAGAENVFGDLEPASLRVGLEAIKARGPELMLVPEQRDGGDAPPPAERPGWDVLEAVREGRVRTVHGDLVHRLGPRLGEAARALSATIHPELPEGWASGAAPGCRVAEADRPGR